MTPAAVAQRNKTRILLAFAAVYVLWGSTYLAIKYAVASFPPFALGATRFFVAGLALYAFARWRGQPAPNRTEWRNAAITGVLMLAFGNGAVIWSEQMVPSGIVAIIVATVPLCSSALRSDSLGSRFSSVPELAVTCRRRERWC